MKNIFLFLIISVLVFFFCASKPEDKWLAQHVVFIGLDGWGAYSVERAEMPNVKALMANGAYTLKKRSVLPSSSAVNWASMLNGAGPEIHGYTNWDSKTPDLPSRIVGPYGIFPTVFGLLREAHPAAKIAYLYEWDGFRHFTELKAMDLQLNLKPDTLTIVACDYLKKEKPALIGIFYDEPDHTGHTLGFDTVPYYEVLKTQDARIGEIVAAVKEAGIYEQTIFILSSDHGGINKETGGGRHGGKTMLEMEAPLILCGKNVRHGLNFDDLSVMQFDIAATIAYIFNLETPQAWIGRPVKEVFEK